MYNFFLKKDKKYIMLYSVVRRSRQCLAYLLFFSFITFHTAVYADGFAQKAEDYRVLGYEAHQKGNLAQALTYYTKAISMGSGLESAVAYNDLGVLYEQIGVDIKAEKCYLTALQLDSEYLPACTNLAYLYKKNGQSDKAFAYFKKRYEMGDPEDIWTQKSKDELIGIRPEYRRVLEARKERQLKDQMQDLSQEMLEQKQNEFNLQIQQANEVYLRGEQFLSSGELDKAREEFLAALKLTPDNPKVLESLKLLELESAKMVLREKFNDAMKNLDAGDAFSAKKNIREMLSTIPEIQ